MLRRLRAGELLRFLLVASILGPALILGLLAWFTYQAAFASAGREIVWTSEVAREHASKVFDSYRLVADRVLDLLKGYDDAAIRKSEQALHDKFIAVIRDLPQLESFIVLDRNAHPLVATAAYPVDSTVDYSDRDYFAALKNGAITNYISRVQSSRITGKSFFGWGRARREAAGDFDGVIDVAVSPQFFMQFYQTLTSEVADSRDGVVTMIRDDGQILVRYPGFEGAPIVVAQSNPFFDAVRANPEGGTYTNRSVIDAGAPERIYAFRRVPGHPIYIVVGRSVSAITRGWRFSMARYLAVGAPATLVLFLLTLATFRGARRERDALAQTRAEMERRTLVEDQLRQSQKMEAVGQLTGGIAHDFNNLLTIIRSSIDMLRRPDLSEDRARRYVDAISDTTSRATKLTGQLLAFARRQALKPEVFNIVENVTSVVEMIRTLTGSRVRIETDLPDAPLYINADQSQFDTSIVNLAVNARDAMDGEGQLEIAVTAVSEIPALRARAAIVGEYIAVSMSDTGKGIAADQLERIFEPFFTTKDVGQGTGLGLSQVIGFAKQSGGEISVESEVGRGATFTLYLPRVEATAPLAEEIDEAEALIDGQGASVLVVEDNADVGAFTIQALSELGYSAVLAANAVAALGVLDGDAQRFDVVFSDVVMPGMNGIELGKEIRRRHTDLPVVLTSGYSDVLAQNGAHGFELLHKPYSIEQLSRTLKIAARWRRRRRALGAGVSRGIGGHSYTAAPSSDSPGAP
jgi:two-component system NtrC family sensor kinase